MANLEVGRGEERSVRVLARLAPTVRDHKHLEAVLASAPPELRSLIYDTLKPNLNFQPKPLDLYIASAGQRAEREQWPTLSDDGKLQPFRVARDVSSIQQAAENAIAADLAERSLTLDCAKCTRREVFHALGDETHVQVVMRARQAGWIYDYLSTPPREICPKCPTSLRPNA